MIALSSRILTSITLIVASAFAIAGQKSRQTEVAVLSTLHNFHQGSKYYPFETLARSVENLKPDVLAVELTASDLETRRTQKTKVEYQQSIFPLIDRHRYIAVPLEPGQPQFGELVSLVQRSEKTLRDASPQKAEAFTAYSDALYDYLFRTWKSPSDVNSRETDALFEVKHDFQNKLFGPEQKRGWDEWNQHFVERILAAADKYPARRIVVLVGVEHAYWLRNRLRANADIRFIETRNMFLLR